MAIRFTFFDVDGTLSVPVYKDNGKSVIGFSDNGWENYCNTHKEDAYEYCKPVLPVKRYAQELKEKGVRLFVLTTSGSPNETAAKKKFVSQHYEGLFEELIAVDADQKKLDAMQQIAEKYGETLSSCELVEDTFRTLLYVNQHNVKPTHISSLVCDL